MIYYYYSATQICAFKGLPDIRFKILISKSIMRQKFDMVTRGRFHKSWAHGTKRALRQ